MASIRFVDVDPDVDLENESPVHGVQNAEDEAVEDEKMPVRWRSSMRLFGNVGPREGRER